MGRFFLGLVIIVLLFFRLIAAGVISMSQSSLREDIELQLGTSGIADSTVNAAIDRAILQVSRDFLTYEKIDSVFLAQDSTQGGLISADLFSALNVYKVFDDTVWMPMTPISKSDFDSLMRRVGGTGGITHDPADDFSPSLYFIYNQKLFTFPKIKRGSGVIDTFIVFYYAADTSLGKDASAPATTAEHREEILSYALWKLSAMIGEKEDALLYKRDYQEALGLRVDPRVSVTR